MTLLNSTEMAEGVERWEEVFQCLALLETVNVPFLRRWIATSEWAAQRCGEPDPQGDACREIGREILKELSILQAIRKRHYQILCQIEKEDVDACGGD